MRIYLFSIEGLTLRELFDSWCLMTGALTSSLYLTPVLCKHLLIHQQGLVCSLPLPDLISSYVFLI